MAQPMINVLNFDMSIPGPSTGDPLSPGTQYRYIDLARELSKVNKKLYRQCRRYAIAGIQVIGNEGSSVSFFTAPDNWITKNATKKMFHAWQKMNQKVLAEAPSTKPTWYDFKVFLDESHRLQNGNELTATPDFGYAPALAGEWVQSQLVYPWTAADQQTSGYRESYLHIVGDHTPPGGSFNPATIVSTGIIEAYKESRSTVPVTEPNTPGTPDLHPFIALNDNGDTLEEISDNLLDNNDSAPYHNTAYLGGANMPVLYNAAEIRVQSSEVVNMTNGFVAPCGLIKVATNQDDGIMRLKVFLVPADNAYGVATEAII